MAKQQTQQTTQPDPAPQTAHCLVDLRWQGKDLLAGEPFPIADMLEADVASMRAVGKIALGEPSTTLRARLSRRSKELERNARVYAKRVREAEANQAKVDAEAEAKELAELEANERGGRRLAGETDDEDLDEKFDDGGDGADDVGGGERPNAEP